MTADAPEPALVRRRARRRAVGGFLGALVVGGFGIATIGLTGDGGIAVFRVVAIALALVALLLSGIATTIARHFPDVAAASGINALLGFVIIAIAVGGVLAVVLLTRPLLLAFAYVLYTVLLSAATAILWNANRQDFRARA